MKDILEQPANYANKLAAMAPGGMVPLSMVFDTARRWPQLPSAYLVAIVNELEAKQQLERSK